jgi:iron complex outermembrane recepter protein
MRQTTSSLPGTIAGTLLLLAALAGPAEAQRGGQGAPQPATLTGRVVDAPSGQGLPSASVAVWRASDESLFTGAMTGVDGSFRIEGVPGGRYNVVVSFVGYQSERIQDVRVGRGGAVVDLGIIRLGTDVEQLGEVEVAAERPMMQIQVDRTVYNVADDPVSAGGSASEVLETIPSVDVDVDGTVSLRGSANVAIHINGRPAPVTRDFLGAYLQQLPAGSIETIEVIPNPSAANDPDGLGGIINIVLRQNVDLGTGGGITAGGDTQGGYNATVNLTHGRGPLSLAGSYGLRRNVRVSEGMRYRINRYLTPTTFLDQDLLTERTQNSHLFNLSADYALAARTRLSASSQLGVSRQASDELTSYAERRDVTGAPFLYERLTDGTGDGWNADFRLGLRQDFGAGGAGRGAGGHSLTADARFNTSSGTDADVFTQRLPGAEGDVLRLQQTASETSRQSGSLQIDYTRPLLGFRTGLGYKGELERIDSDFYSETRDSLGVFVPDAGRINAFDYDQQIHAVYGQAGREIGPLGIQLGVRLETARTSFALANTGEAFDNNYLSAFPSAFLSYELNQANILRASYSRRIHRMRTRFLNPFPRFDDPLNISVGNPALRPQYVDSVEMGYVRHTGWGSLTFSPYYRRTTDIIRRVQQLRDDGVTVSTFENLDTSSSYGLELIGAFEGRGIFSGLRGYASVEGFRVVTDGSSVDADLASDAFGWGGRVNASYVFTPGLTLQANVRYRAPMATEQGRTTARTFINLALRQQLLDDRASLTLSVRDPFATASFGSVIDQPLIYQEFERSMGGRQLGLTFTYNFGQRPQRQRDRGGREDRPEFEDLDLDQ